jgi:hypothetical protein
MIVQLSSRLNSQKNRGFYWTYLAFSNSGFFVAFKMGIEGEWQSIKTRFSNERTLMDRI